MLFRSLVGQSQLSSAEKSIDAAAKTKIDKLQADIESLQKTSDKQGAALSSGASATQAKSDKLKVAYNDMINFIQNLRITGGSASITNSESFAKLINNLKAAGATKEMINQFAPSGTAVTYTSQSSKGVKEVYGGAMKDLGNLLGDKMTSQIATNTGTMVDQLNRMIVLMHGQPVAKSSTAKSGPVPLVPSSHASGGLIRAFDNGGAVVGAGTATSDSIPAMLSNGEYVVNAKSVANLGVPFMDQINKMATGGLVGASYHIPTSTVMPNMNMLPAYAKGGVIHHYDVGGFVVNAAEGQSERDIATMVVSMLDSRNMQRAAMNGVNRTI